MLSSPRQRALATDTYNKFVTQEVLDDAACELLHTTIAELKAQGANIAEMSLLYSLESEILFENKMFDDAYRWAMDAFRTDSERKEVLELMIKIYSPLIESVGSAQTRNANPYVDDEKARECAVTLESLYSQDPDALYSAATCYSSLGLYDDALRVLKQSFFKITSKVHHDDNHVYSKEMVEEIKRTITQTFIERYSSCDNDCHETIIRYLIELVEWQHSDFGVQNVKICVVEIWERLEYLIEKHLEKMHDQHLDAEGVDHEWGRISNLLSSIPCSIPLSSKLLAQIAEILHFHAKFHDGVEFFTRLITEYQMYSNNMATIYAKFGKYELLYLYRAKLYQGMGRHGEMMDDIQRANHRMLETQDGAEQVTVHNLAQYVLIDAEEEPQIETADQIRKRRASRTSNIVISPMPRQYRDSILTPKKGKKSKSQASRTGNARRKRYKSVASGFAEHKETEEESSKFESLETKNRVLQNRIVDLKNDLHRETEKKRKDRQEMERLQSKISEMTAQLDRTVIENLTETQQQQGEGDDVAETAPDPRVQALAEQNQTYQEKMEAMKREIKILRDCQSKLTVPKKKRTRCCNVMLFMVGMLVTALLFAGCMVHLYGWGKSTDFLVDMQADLQREVVRLIEAARPTVDEWWKRLNEFKDSVIEQGTGGGEGAIFKAEV